MQVDPKLLTYIYGGNPIDYRRRRPSCVGLGPKPRGGCVVTGMEDDEHHRC
jgi:hypothetical protein